ncbi:MAG: FAD-dependent oxidoreductase, partial [Verrucomicrobiae bacterium]|nr:FAD-dependent oxidoreductase [Verrucomicrobiae bacterium]
SRHASEVWADFAAELEATGGVPVPYARTGGLLIALEEAELAANIVTLEGLRREAGTNGYDFDVLDHAALARRLPQIGPDVAGATYCPHDGHANPLKLLHGLHAGFRARGGTYRAGAPVADIAARTGGGFRIQAGGETVESSRELEQLLPAPPQGCKEALVRAMSREEQDRVATHWSDAYPPAHELAMKLDELPAAPRFRASDFRTTPKSAPALFASVCRIGGREGWCNTNWMWRMRGAIDRLFLGVGTARGRRCERTLQLHDAVDFWRVERLEKDARLLLRAEMKLPGKAWLEFRIEPEPAGGGNRLSVIAWFAPHGWAGWLYWWFFVPFHWLIFNDLVRGIEKRA